MTGQRKDPYAGFQFYVDIGDAQAIFTECSGLKVETEVLEYSEGGRNDYTHRLPGRVKIGNISLKRGVTSGNELLKWLIQFMQGQRQRRNISIHVYDPLGSPVLRWELREAYPVKWEGPAFKAADNTVAIETLELAHSGLIQS